jgi:MFS family permease
VGNGLGISLGLRANLGQFAVLVGVTGLVGAMVGQERSLLPLLATNVFGLTGASAILTFLVAFGLSKAAANLAAGAFADRLGRKPVLVAGWLIGLPVPLLIIWADSWSWIVLANVLLGVNQGLTWSTTAIMKIDLVGPSKRGLALGLNEAAGYGAVAIAALVTGAIGEQAGLRPAPFLFGLAIAGLGLTASTLLVRETSGHVQLETAGAKSSQRLAWRDVFLRTTLRDPSLSAACQAGLVNNLNDGVAWGLFPIYFAAAGLSVGEIGVLAATYPAVWAVGQIATGALSDRVGRRPLIVAGMLVQAFAIAAIAVTSSFGAWLAASVALGVGTALVYPTLLAAVADGSAPAWRGSAVGVYRLWRDLGFAGGAIVAGLVADVGGLPLAILVVAAMTAASGLIVRLRMAPGGSRAHGGSDNPSEGGSVGIADDR